MQLTTVTLTGPCGVIGSTVLLTTLGQDMKSKSTAIATYHVPQLALHDRGYQVWPIKAVVFEEYPMLLDSFISAPTVEND